MKTLAANTLTAQHEPLDMSLEAFGWLRPSEPELLAATELNQRLEEDGYLYLPGLLDSEKVLEIRQGVLEKLAENGDLHPDYPAEDGIVAPGSKLAFSPDLVQQDPQVRELLFNGPVMDFTRRLFAEPVLHFNYIWFRTMSRGLGTPPHCDLIYMGRGTRRLYTTWIPYGTVDLDLGGLMLLEGSHRKADQIRKYLDMDVDTYCTNRPEPKVKHPNNWRISGALSKNPRTLRKKLGGRWLTAENYQPGDVLLFGMELIHASLDNHTDRVRLSSDTRYQRASEPADERWIGENPIGHGPNARRGLIC